MFERAVNCDHVTDVQSSVSTVETKDQSQVDLLDGLPLADAFDRGINPFELPLL